MHDANSQRGLCEAQNGYGFGMLPGHGLRDGALSSLDGSPACKLFTALELGRVISLRKKSSKWVPKWVTAPPSKPGFKHSISISNRTEEYWWGSGGKRSSDGLVVRAHVRYLCQNRPKIEGEHPPRPPGSSSSPQIFQQPSFMSLMRLSSR